jgi:NADPH-dependent 7-cyano-7-deazaguanine reductase QueF-like protein
VRIYAEAVSGRWSPSKTLTTATGKPFDEIATFWLADIEPTVDPKTFRLYQDTFIKTHFAPFFPTIDRLTTAA